MSGEFNIDIDGITELVGLIDGMTESFQEADYLDALANEAHNNASVSFDQAAASAGAAGHLKHVYEFGVTGITKGLPRFADPTAPEARLYTHTMGGSRGMYEINYLFRPAVAPNPRPTTKDTGVPSAFLRRISRRKYVFTNKALIMESGQEVSVEPKRGRYLFIPFGGETSKSGRPYMMWDAERLGPIETVPGRATAGTFTSFWEGWWGSEGERQMNTEIERQVNVDVAYAIKQAEARARASRPVPAKAAAAQLVAATESAKKSTKVAIKRNSQARRRKKRR